MVGVETCGCGTIKIIKIRVETCGCGILWLVLLYFNVTRSSL